jgi:hypothetical protein
MFFLSSTSNLHKFYYKISMYKRKLEIELLESAQSAQSGGILFN